MKKEKTHNSPDNFALYESDRRKFPRVPTRNTLSYICIDKNGNKLNQGMGRALDISCQMPGHR
jgi:hypothetical protein